MATGKVPVTPDVSGNPSALVKVTDVGVPKIGVIKVAEVCLTKGPVPVNGTASRTFCTNPVVANFVELSVRTATVTPIVFASKVLFDSVSVPAKVDNVPVVGKVTAVGPVAVNVCEKAPAVAKVLPSAKVKLAAVAGVVIVNLLTVVAIATPKVGVTKVGEVAKTAEPVPVSSVTAPDKFAEVNDPKEVAFPDEITIPVKSALVVTFPAVKPEAVPVIFVPTSADGVPKAGVTKVGEVAKTAEPVPVSSVTAADKFAEVNDPKEVAFPDEVTIPVKSAFVVFALSTYSVVAKAVVLSPTVCVTPIVPVGKDGVPVKVGESDKTTLPVPVEAVTPVPPLATGNIPVTPDVSGNPSALVKVTDVGVPKIGVIKVAEVCLTKGPVPVNGTASRTFCTNPVVANFVELSVRTATVTPIVFASKVLFDSVSVPAKVDNVPVVGKVTAVGPVAVNVCEKAPAVAKVLPSAKVKLAAVAGVVIVNLLTVVAIATPKVGVTKVGEVAKTAEPVPVSSVTAPDKFAEVNDPKEVVFPTEVTIPVKFAFVVFALSTYVFVAFSVGNLTSELEANVPSVLLLTAFSFRLSADCPAILTGLSRSFVLSTFSKPKFVFAPTTVTAFVPPF